MVTSVEEEFISRFHSLSGVTIGERRKNLFLLLNQTNQSLKAASCTIDVSSLQPRTPLEENFKIESLLYFKNIPEILHVLKSGNPILIEKILNVKLWFINQALEQVSGEELATQIFPHLSYNTKLKLIHKLSFYMKDTQKADEYCEAIKETYGAYLALKILPACSADLIMKCIETNRVEITPRQLLTIIKRYPDITESIFEKLSQYNYKIAVGEKYKIVFTYLAQHNVSLFLILHEKYNPKIALGSRATNTMICRERENILESPKRYYDLLKTKRIGRNLKEDFSKIYIKLFPKSLKRLEEHLDCHLRLLKFLPSDSARLNMLLMTFKAKHGSELWDHPPFIVPKLIQMMSPDEREVWMQRHPKPNEISEDDWITFMKTEKSVRILKEKISFTSKIKDRAKLLGLLIATCNINKDSSSFLEVCKYIMDKHRNESSLVKEEIFRAMNTSIDCLTLEDDHWKYINELITLWKLKEGKWWAVSEIVKKYICYCFEKNLPVKELLKEWAKLNKSYKILQEKPEYEKKCLMIFKEMFPSAYKKEDLERKYIEYFNALYQWNRRHPKDKFSLFVSDDAIKHLISYLRKETYAYTEERVAEACVFSEYEKSQKFNLLEVLLKRAFNYCRRDIISWVVKKQPLFLRDNTELVLEMVLKMIHAGNMPDFCRYYTHLEIPQKVSEICLNALNEENGSKITTAAEVLSHTMNSNEFLNLPALHPTNLAVDIESEEGQNTYQLQQALFPCLRNVIPPSLALAVVVKFCRGDYLNLIQRSLYSLAHNVSENELVPCFEALGERAVSVRKHGIFLAFKVSNKAQAYKILNKFMETEKNASIHKSLFKAIFNFFIRNPDDYSWELAKQSVKALHVNDNEAFNILSKCRRIPSSYFVRYVLFTWGILEEFSNANDVIEEGKCRILESVTSENVSKLPKEFCEKIIEKYFLKTNELSNTQLKCHSFTCKYIIYYTQGPEQKQTMRLVFATLENYIKSTWYDPNTSAVGRKTVSNFLTEFCSYFIEKKCLNKDTIDTFVTFWNDTLKPFEAFGEYLHLQFTMIYLACINEKLTMLQVGEKLAKLCDALNTEGLFVLTFFCESLSIFVTKFSSINDEDDAAENKMTITEGIIETSKSPSCLALVVSLLPKYVSMAPNIKQKYDNILEVAMKEPNSIVKVYLHHYLINRY